MHKNFVPETQVMLRLHLEIRRAGSLRAYARKIGCSAAYLSDVMNNRRAPGPLVLQAIGVRVKVRRVTVREYSANPNHWYFRTQLESTQEGT